MTRDARGREVFSIAPALLGGAATYRTLAPAQAGVNAQQGQDDQPPGSEHPAGSAAAAGGGRGPEQAR